jgi:SAM-dependent methyltransferase
MSSAIGWLDKKLYPSYISNWDDRLFRERILDYLQSDSVVLDLGAGAGIVSQMNFRGLPMQMCGVDLDPRVVDNPMLDEGRVASATGIPYEDNRFDVVFSDNVLEHLEEPLQVFREVNRVLKPGGVFLFKTPNKYHYMPVIARLTPHVFHQYINRLRGRAEVDTFPTRYRANSRDDVIQLATAADMLVEQIELIEGRPEYMRMTWLSYLAGMAYERMVNASELFAMFRILLVGILRKKMQ